MAAVDVDGDGAGAGYPAVGDSELSGRVGRIAGKKHGGGGIWAAEEEMTGLVTVVDPERSVVLVFDARDRVTRQELGGVAGVEARGGCVEG